MSSTEKSEMARQLASFSIVDLKDYDVVKTTIHYIQPNHIFQKLKILKAEAEENVKKSKFNFMGDLKTLIHKISVDPELLQMKVCLRNRQKERTPKKSPIFTELTNRFDLPFSGDKICDSRVVKETSDRCTAFWKTRLDKNASPE